MIQAADTVGVFQIESRAQMQTLPQLAPGDARRPRRRGGDHPARPNPGQRRASIPAATPGQGGGDLPPSQPPAGPRGDDGRDPLPGAGDEDRDRRRRLQRGRVGRLPQGDGHVALVARRWRSCTSASSTAASSGNGLTTEQAEELFRQVAAFASFGFNKSHAAAFARTAYETRVPEALLPGPVRDRPDQRPADGLLPGRGAHQRREAPRRRGPAGRHQQEPLPDHDRVGRHAGRATARLMRASTSRPEIVDSSACVVPDRAARDRWAAPTAEGLRHPPGARPGQGHRRGGRGGARRGGRAQRAVHVARGSRRAHRAAGGDRRAADPRWRARLARRAAAQAPLAAARGRRFGTQDRAPDQPRGRQRRSICACHRLMRPTYRHLPSSNGWATPTRSSRSTRAAR